MISIRPGDDASPVPRETNDASFGADGEILVRAPMLFRCYRDGTDGRVVGPDGTAGWFATGDAGRWDADGRLTVSGRIDDLPRTAAGKVRRRALEGLEVEA